MEDNYFEVEHSTPLLSEFQQADDAPQIDLEPQGPRPPPRRKRLAQVSLVLVALVAVVVLVRGVLAKARPTPGVADTPMPTTPPPPATTLLLSNITFGTVTINGQQQQTTVPLFFGASRTTYKITINAPPFQPKTCTIIFSDNGPAVDTSNSACLIGDGTFPIMTLNGITATPLYAIEMDFKASDLPPDQQQQINNLLAHMDAIRQTTTASAGSYIATGLNADNTITSQRITSSLQATASLSVPTSGEPSQFSCEGLICLMACDPHDPTSCADITGMAWLVGVPVTLSWRFTTAGGRVVANVTFPSVATVPKLLTYDPTTGWNLSDQPLPADLSGFTDIGSMDCDTGIQVLQQLFQSMTGFNFAISGGAGIEGCLITGEPTNGSNPGSFVWRFGVLLAADDAAHQSLPNLPIAPQAEINAVQGKGG